MRSTQIGLLAGVLAFAGAALAEKQPFSRYQSIVDRQMFGRLPPGFDPTKMPSEVTRSSSAEERELTKEQEKLQSAIHFSVINLTPEGETAVGFSDNSDAKQPRHYYLKVGETRDGWTVSQADAAEGTMTIVRDEVEVSLKIGENSGKGGGSTGKAGGVSGGPATSRMGLGGRRPNGLLGGMNSLRSRRLQREQVAKEEAAKRAEREEAEKAEREAKAAAEKAERDAEREEQRKQLQAIQDELKKAREQSQKAKEEKGEDEGNDAE